MVPNLFTVANMGLGFFAILRSIEGQWMSVAWAILFAQLMDVLDGRIARWLNTTSDFGMEFDSFADWISFGIAPAVAMYFLVLKNYGELGLALAFFYVLCGAIRLTKFNLKAFDPAPKSASSNFTGLPIPGAGGFLAVTIMLMELSRSNNPGNTFPIIYNMVPYLIKGIPIIVFVLSLLMISRIQYQAFKKTHVFRPRSQFSFLVLLFVSFLIYAYPSNTIFIMYVSYLSWGLINAGLRAARITQKKKYEEEKPTHNI